MPNQMFDSDPVFAGPMYDAPPAPRPQRRPAPPPQAAARPQPERRPAPVSARPAPRPVMVPSPDELGIHLDPEALPLAEFPTPDELGIGGL